MDGRVVYEMLLAATEELKDLANQLDDPIDLYMKQQSQIGEDGASAWGGTAATSIIPVLSAIKADIVELQNASNEFSVKVRESLKAYQAADIIAKQGVEAVKDAAESAIGGN